MKAIRESRAFQPISKADVTTQVTSIPPGQTWGSRVFVCQPVDLLLGQRVDASLSASRCTPAVYHCQWVGVPLRSTFRPIAPNCSLRVFRLWQGLQSPCQFLRSQNRRMSPLCGVM